MTVYEPEDSRFTQYLRMKKEIYEEYCPDVSEESLRSECTWLKRYGCRCGTDIGIHVSPGDLAMIDYGQTYYNEAGFRHFGLVVSICVHKALVIPMTSNPQTYQRAYDIHDNPDGRKNLFRIGQVPGMDKKSVLFLNDARYINTARVIRVMAHIDTTDAMFADIRKRLQAIMFPAV